MACTRPDELNPEASALSWINTQRNSLRGHHQCALFTGNACTSRGFANSFGHEWSDTSVENRGNDVISAQFIGRNCGRNGMCGGEVHLLVDISGTRIDGPAKDARETQ